jgi:DNA-binding SARP family transcriptional activator/tetratricopeptide (TPR) repeat protein
MTSSDISVLLLGPVEVRHDGKRLRLTRLELTLAAGLATAAGRPVSAARLIEFLWSADPPASAANRVQALVSGIRRRLGPAAGVLRTVAPGYLLDVEPGQVDASEFERLVASARSDCAAGRKSAAADKLSRSLRLWRGTALDSVQGTAAELYAAHLEEMRLQALEYLAGLLLDDGRGADLLPRLSSELTRHPERERLRLLVMRALDGAGRRAEALLTFHEAVRFSRDELGVDPGPELSELHHRLLDGPAAGPGPHPARESRPVPAPGSPAPQPGHQPPAQLPADADQFTGREREQQALMAALTTRPSGSALVVTVSGMAGVGKTALTVHAARQLAGRYPDGQLFTDLHGFTDGIRPVDPGAALDRLLRVLGVPADGIPETLDDRAALYRGRLAGRRMLLVFDNAASETQVAPLLPATPGSLVFITSRSTLAGLDGTLPLALDALGPADATHLLCQLLDSPDVITSQAAAAAEVVALCGGLPLAIRLVASRLRHRRMWTLSYLADRLRESSSRLSELHAGERSVAGALALSFRDLDSRQQHLFRMLGLSPCPDTDSTAAAALAGAGPGEAERLLEQLVDAHLLEQPAPGRYQAHDLVRLFATELAAQLAPADQGMATTRLFRHYLWGACAAMAATAPYTRNRRQVAAMAGSTFPPFASYGAAFAWLEAERENLLAVTVAAGERGFPGLARTLCEAIFYVLETGGHFSDGLRVNEYVARLMHESGDVVGEATALRSCGVLARHLGRSTDAMDYLRRALAVLEGQQPSLYLASVLVNLGELETDIGRLAEGARHLEQALRIIRDGGDKIGEEYCLRIYSQNQWLRGQHAAAIESAELSAAISRSAEHHAHEAYAHLALGGYLRQLGRLSQAMDHLQRATRLWSRVVDATGTSLTLSETGATHTALGQFGQAHMEFRAALRTAREAGDRGAEFEALLGIGEMARAAGDLASALRHCRAAAELAQQLRRPRSIAQARDALARTQAEADGSADGHCGPATA